MKADTSRRAVRFGLIGTTAIIVAVLVVFNYRSLPFWPGATTVVAEFADASGISAGDDIQIAGVPAGDIRSITLRDDHVDVTMRLTSGWKQLGAQTSAAIKVETALGKRYIQLDTAGSGQIGDRIPMSRTTSGFDLTDSLQQLTTTVKGTDKPQLANAVRSLTDVMTALPPNLAQSLDGLSGAADTIASRDAGIRTLLQRANSVTGVLADRNHQLTTMIDDGAVLFQELNDRAAVIRSVLVSVRRVSDEISALVRDTKASTPPMLTELQKVTATLNANYDNINASITGLKPFVTQLGEVVGSGPFFSVLLHNIAPANLRGQQPGSPGGGR
ncbi:MCE family protein [Gordonia sputi]